MPKCTFCGKDITKGTGKLYIYASGKVANFCSNKCEKNLIQLKRKPVETQWTEAFKKEHKKGSYKPEGESK
ncbi:50S ribosomal protein L24e [Candidatus Woesearchaeota archaeon CG10_big_fil_rev_8_21_14_0_10_32_24]|nr:MAG: 50S ribosomal protein L24e [Candidatus Woesearchaeota archaeon CG10_big_fil_rev_8_21_14_0_10_32_24]